jgi:hypothetical protein
MFKISFLIGTWRDLIDQPNGPLSKNNLKNTKTFVLWDAS